MFYLLFLAKYLLFLWFFVIIPLYMPRIIVHTPPGHCLLGTQDACGPWQSSEEREREKGLQWDVMRWNQMQWAIGSEGVPPVLVAVHHACTFLKFVQDLNREKVSCHLWNYLSVEPTEQTNTSQLSLPTGQAAEALLGPGIMAGHPSTWFFGLEAGWLSHQSALVAMSVWYLSILSRRMESTAFLCKQRLGLPRCRPYHSTFRKFWRWG